MPLHDVWVVANFKEDQIADIKDGQHVRLKIDAYPDRVFNAHVDSVQAGFDYWVDGTDDPTGEVAASLEGANASVVPTARLGSVSSAYWCRMRQRTHLRWVLPEDEELLLDAMARLAGGDGLSLGEGSRYIGSFRAHGLLVPVWDLPGATEAEQVEGPAAAVRARLDQALADTSPLTAEQRRARSGLLSRQLTIR